MLNSTLLLLSEHRCIDSIERNCRERMLAVCAEENSFDKEFYSPGHFTASAFVLSRSLDRVLLIHHRKVGDWIQPGGHIESGDRDLRGAALRELEEETTLAEVVDLALVDLDIHDVPKTSKGADHLHFDVRFFFQSNELRRPSSSGVRWFPIEGLDRFTGDASVLLAMRRLGVRMDRKRHRGGDGET